MAVVQKGNEPSVERQVPVCGKQKTIHRIEAFGISITICPGLNVACPQKLGLVESRNSAPTSPQVDKGLAKHILTDTLNDEALCLC